MPILIKVLFTSKFAFLALQQPKMGPKQLKIAIVLGFFLVIFR